MRIPIELVGVDAVLHENEPNPVDLQVRLLLDFAPGYLVISAGMDIYADDPLGKIRVTTEGIREIGKRISALDLPTVIVMEGGYNNEALGKNIISFLGEFE